MHLSDCEIHDDKNCTCGNLDLTKYPAHRYIPTLIASAGRFGFFIDHMGGECFIEPEELPPHTLAAIAAASNLPDASDAIAILGNPNSVNLDNAREAVITKFNTLLAT